MPQYVDLHTHSNASDGTDAPAELVRKAGARGLAALALTDHDTLAGLEEAEAAARSLGSLEFVRGVEVSTAADFGKMHIVGLWVPRDAEPLEKRLAEMRQKRFERSERMVERLNLLGLDLTMDEVLAEAGGGSVGRPHIARVLLAKGYVSSLTEAFERYIGAGGRAFVPKEVMTPEEAVRLLSSLGCSVVIAHPLYRERPAGWLDGVLRRLVPCGLCGVEAWHSEHSEEASHSVLDLAEAYHLCVSGGSDYHGANKPHIQLGTGYGSLSVSAEAFACLKAWRKDKGLPCD